MKRREPDELHARAGSAPGPSALSTYLRWGSREESRREGAESTRGLDRSNDESPWRVSQGDSCHRYCAAAQGVTVPVVSFTMGVDQTAAGPKSPLPEKLACTVACSVGPR